MRGLLVSAILIAGACRAPAPVDRVSTSRSSLATATWTQHAAAPSKRHRTSLAYDAHRGRMVLFGGTELVFSYDNGFKGDSWEWDGSAWSQVDPVHSPSPRRMHAMVFDPIRRRVVLFGGATQSGVSNETWEWDGVDWTPGGSGPSARFGHALTYDTARARIVLFGGEDATGTYLGDTWERDPMGAWSQVASTGPRARSEHALAYNPDRSRVMLTAGNSSLSDVWEWDGATWTRADSPIVSPRAGHTMVTTGGVAWIFGGRDAAGTTRDDTYWYGNRQWFPGPQMPGPRAFGAAAADPSTGNAIFFGGWDGSAPTSETWEWDGLSFSGRDGSGPAARTFHAMASLTTRGRVFVHGGLDAGGSVLSDLWSWNGSSWDPETPGPALSGHTAAEVGGNLLVFGGTDGADVLGDLWVYDGSTWNDLGPGPAPARAYHTGHIDPADGSYCVHGGIGADGVLLVDGWCTTDGNVWFPDDASGLPPTKHAGVASLGTDVVHFGGEDAYGAREDTWWVNNSVSYWTADAPPGPGMASGHSLHFDVIGRTPLQLSGSSLWRWSNTAWSFAGQIPYRFQEAAAMDTSRGRLFVFGGRGYLDSLGDTLEWSAEGWTRRVPAQPEGAYPTMAYHAPTGRVVMHTGLGGETWIWDGQEWTRSAASGPGPRSGAMMAAFPPTGEVLFGGGTGDGKLWRWNGLTWTQDPAPSSPALIRSGGAMAYDASEGRMVIFGGVWSMVALNDTWTYSGAGTWQAASTGPSPRAWASLVYDAAREELLLLGGGNAGRPPSSEMWVRKQGQWELHAAALPAPRWFMSAAYDTARGRILAFGGNDGTTYTAETWEWDGVAWATSVTGPVARYAAANAFDANRQEWLLFGGNSSFGQRNDTWTYRVRGNSCTAGWECNTGHCVDGVCCTSIACGTCERCDGGGALDGTCTPVAGADPDSCVDGKTCVIQSIGTTSVGVCGFGIGVACVAPGDCQSGNCVDGLCCDSACTGDCQSCNQENAPGTCLPVPLDDAYAGRNGSCGLYLCAGTSPSCATSCTSDQYCDASSYCDATGHCVPRKLQGVACNRRAGFDCLVAGCRSCESGFCTDGFCCDALCILGCETCAAARGAVANGQCTTLADGATGRPDCGTYLCGGSMACETSCTSDADCVGGGSTTYCIAGVCQGHLPLGATCTADLDCASTHCVDGVCCDGACAGDCVACNEPSALGTCSLTPTARDGDCAGDGVCAGSCGGSDATDAHCVFPDDNRCGVCLTCDGKGHCVDAPASTNPGECPPIDCSALDTDCRRYRTGIAGRCLAPGQCATTTDPGSCVEFDTALDGTLCSTGVCSSGECVAKPPSSGGCSLTGWH